jgi:hypothetical protein
MPIGTGFLEELFNRGFCIQIQRHPLNRRVAAVSLYYYQHTRVEPLVRVFEVAPSAIEMRTMEEMRLMELIPAPPQSSMRVQLRIAQDVDESLEAGPDEV